MVEQQEAITVRNDVQKKFNQVSEAALKSQTISAAGCRRLDGP